MRLSLSLSLSLLSLPLLSLSTLTSASATSISTEIFYWPLSPSSSSSPSPLAQITYNPSTLKSTMVSYTPPQQPSNSDSDSTPLLRIGLSPSPPAWTGTLTSLSHFASPAQTLTLTLHLDADGNVYQAAVSGGEKEGGVGGDKNKQPLRIEFVRPNTAPNPQLNRPVVLREDGNLPEAEVERPLWQKYWWALALIGVLAFTGSAE
ncbi:hypothetical protein FQN50_002921 [Emmonsiellopsis sp. PD_5]|nr:hypothetical protein FQN50_002921 [Emmonsiellopsis sp. PD_5]